MCKYDFSAQARFLVRMSGFLVGDISALVHWCDLVRKRDFKCASAILVRKNDFSAQVQY